MAVWPEKKFYKRKKVSHQTQYPSLSQENQTAGTLWLRVLSFRGKRAFTLYPRASSLHARHGFTLIELLVVVAIIGILAMVIMMGINSARNKAYTARAMQEFRSFQEAMELYLMDYGNYPADVNRNIPSGMEEYLGGGSWPSGPYPGSVYDWDNKMDTNGYIQISLRFCDIDGNNCRFPTEAWAENFDDKSAMYFCFEGPCRSHPSEALDHPGYCVNC